MIRLTILITSFLFGITFSNPLPSETTDFSPNAPGENGLPSKPDSDKNTQYTNKKVGDAMNAFENIFKMISSMAEMVEKVTRGNPGSMQNHGNGAMTHQSSDRIDNPTPNEKLIEDKSYLKRIRREFDGGVDADKSFKDRSTGMAKHAKDFANGMKKTAQETAQEAAFQTTRFTIEVARLSMQLGRRAYQEANKIMSDVAEQFSIGKGQRSNLIDG